MNGYHDKPWPLEANDEKKLLLNQPMWYNINYYKTYNLIVISMYEIYNFVDSLYSYNYINLYS